VASLRSATGYLLALLPERSFPRARRRSGGDPWLLRVFFATADDDRVAAKDGVLDY
jgi:hypothetical protein